MFLIGIFGIENKEKEIKFINNIFCRNCDSGLGGKVIKTFKFFHFFFIPIFKWDKKYYVICSGCNSIYEISNNKGERIERGEDIEITYWDLKPIDGGFYKENYSPQNICANCGRVVENDFKYCPYCGQKIK